MVPPPNVLGLALCEKVIVEEGTKNITLVNCFTKMFVEAFPSPPQRFALFAALTGGFGDGIIELIGTWLDTDEVIYSFRNTVRFVDRLREVRVVVRVNDCSFPASGRYQFTLMIDGEWIA